MAILPVAERGGAVRVKTLLGFLLLLLSNLGHRAHVATLRSFLCCFHQTLHILSHHSPTAHLLFLQFRQPGTASTLYSGL